METILVERNDVGVVTMTLNRPTRKNAIDSVMWDELGHTFRDIQCSTSDRVVVITGAADAFCSGQDLAAMSGGVPRHGLQRMLNNAFGATMEQPIEEEGWSQTVNFDTQDTAEAMAACTEKRDPRFQGR